MPRLGACDPCFSEWYVALENANKMLNSGSGIHCVVYQHNECDVIDGVVVKCVDGNTQMCYQIKHNIETASMNSVIE